MVKHGTKSSLKMLGGLFIIVGFCIIGYGLYISHNSLMRGTSTPTNTNTGIRMFYNTGDVLTNPFAPPLKNDYQLSRKIPINVSTNVGAVDAEYRQMGIITPLNGSSKDSILPLMGRPLYTNRNKYQYYTISNQHNNVKLPVSVKGKSALDEYGVDELYNGDTVYVEGYNDAFKATIYSNNIMRYLPF